MGFAKQDSSSSSSSSYTLKMPPPPREDTPLLGKGPPLSSQFKTFANIFIAVVGAGVLGLPYAFKRTGWLMGVLLLLSVSVLTHHCMMLLVYTRRKLDSLNGGFSKIGSFGDLGFAVCGSLGRLVVDLFIILSQAGFCVGYLIFIGTTLANLFDPDSPTSLRHQFTRLGSDFLGVSSKSLYIWGCFPFQLGLNSIKTLTHLAPLSIFADVVDLAAMAVVIVEDSMIILKQRPDVVAFGGMSLFFYGMGVAVYSFEGVGMVLPLESEMKDKDKFGKVLALGMGFISFIYIAFGFLGYLAFGEDTMDIITANLGAGLISSIVQLGLCINLFFTFPLMMNPVFEIVERRFSGGMYSAWLRWLLVLAVTLVALFVPNFTDFLSLVGSSTCCILGFVLPALFHLLVFKEEMGWKQWSLDMAIVGLGVVLAVSGTWSSLSEIFSVKV
ncbi:Amino acid transporter ANTL2 [Raphanus sativus]|uniref:Amino acid transporter AVT3C n=2 Tax=Raphanus sativus TaxID=3726 RepID=A0A6J0MXG3_RAPSA|nr:amino acid transporter AVT3C [Raphanus sativus]XP_056857128.1 amino acid transporter AVT3C [Raphanus sativus]KAJ4866863.1 Amino acid transporter ANTL2 [Raphanus sativus]KAJ4914419.1 Amino acid transporter ANTL2 [Raphanus sativus]